MRIANLTAAVLLLSTPVLAQASFTMGQKVEAYNSTTGKWESATVTRVEGSRYLLHSDSSTVMDWDVDNSQIRSSGSAISNAAANPATSNGGVSGSGAASGGGSGGSASGGASVGVGSGGVIGGANAGVGWYGGVTTP